MRESSAAPYQIVDGNLREAMRFFGQATGLGEVRDYPGVSVICSGLNYAVFNLTLLAEQVFAEDVLEGFVRTPAAHFAALGMRWSYWMCEDLLEGPVRRRARGILARNGLHVLTEPPGMVADSLRPPARPLPEIECRRVEDVPTRQCFAHIASITFDTPPAVARQVYEPEGAWHGSYQGYVGYVDGVPVTTAAAVVAGGAIGFYSVGTLPAHRRKGYAEALMRQIYERLSLETGITCTVLQATESGFTLYRRMGYRPVTKFVVYLFNRL